MKRLIVSKYLVSAAFAVAAFAAASLAPAYGQARSHYGSPLPRYYNAEGEQIWGSWAPPAADQQVTGTSHALYMYVKPRRSRARVH
ncbi:MAG: hypothetical protein WBQ24_07495 [Xanthobacteraceae bacterium]